MHRTRALARTLFKWALRSAAGVLLFVASYAMAAWILPKVPVNNEFQEPEGGQLIFIRSNGVHTDLVLPLYSPTIDWRKNVPFANTASKDSAFNYVSFGWGDKGFYLETKEWADLKATTAIKAAFGLSGSAMHVEFSQEPIVDSQCRAVRVSEATLARLSEQVEAGFMRGSDKLPVWIAGRYYGSNDSFYEGTGSYGLFFTCNTWANSVLKKCGLPAALWTATDGGILRQYP